MRTTAVVFEQPGRLALRDLPLTSPTPDDVVVEIDWSAISTGTERLLWTGRMPPFPGLAYPLVPGYESVGRVVRAQPGARVREGDHVFVPGASCFGAVRGLFGGAARTVVVPAARVVPIDPLLGENALLLALAATARHALAVGPMAELIVGHGVLGRLLARLVVLAGGAPTVWERNARRATGAEGYLVTVPEEDPRRDYGCILDASGDASMVEPLMARLDKGGELVLAGFYAERIAFDFALAFMKEARLRVAAEWRPEDLAEVHALAREGRLRLDGLLTHRRAFTDAEEAYRVAFWDPECLKMSLDWRMCA